MDYEDIKKLSKHTNLVFEVEELTDNGKIGKHLEIKCDECGFLINNIYTDYEPKDEQEAKEIDDEIKEHFFKKVLREVKLPLTLKCSDYVMWDIIGRPKRY
jgi:hypothetical protein